MHKRNKGEWVQKVRTRKDFNNMPPVIRVTEKERTAQRGYKYERSILTSNDIDTTPENI